ncbi:MAG: carbohydrate kinase family protein [archaeon]
MAKDNLALYRIVLKTALNPKKIAVYGIANYDDVFSISKEHLANMKINPVFDEIASRALKSQSYREYNRDIHLINEAITRLKDIPLKEKVILGGNSTNISLGLTSLGNITDLNVKRATKDMIKQLKSAGVSTVNSSLDEAAHHLIVQVKEDGDRFIISPDYGTEEPELVDFVDNESDFAVYSGAHLDAKKESVQKELLKRVKNISKKSKLYIELGSGSRMAEDNCRKVSKHADIVGMNEVELKAMTGVTGIVEGAAAYHRHCMKPSSILLIHTLKGSLALSKKPCQGIEKAQVLGHLEGSARYITGRYMGQKELRKQFRIIELHKEEITNNTGYSISWVPGIKYIGDGMSVGAGDGYVAGFVAGLLNFTKSR